MSQKEITIARVYTLEGHDHLNRALNILRHDQGIAGLTVLRGIAGIGSSGEVHTSSLLSLSMELPLVIEFFDDKEKVENAIAALKAQVDIKHIISWSAITHI